MIIELGAGVGSSILHLSLLHYSVPDTLYYCGTGLHKVRYELLTFLNFVVFQLYMASLRSIILDTNTKLWWKYFLTKYFVLQSLHVSEPAVQCDPVISPPLSSDGEEEENQSHANNCHNNIFHILGSSQSVQHNI